MRQFLAIAIAFIYLVLSAGLQLTTHYCHGELESVKVLSEIETCCCGETESKSSCCSNEVFSIQADIDSHLSAETRTSTERYIFFTEILISFSDSIIEKEQLQDEFIESKSPPILKQPLWLLNSSFTLYG